MKRFSALFFKESSEFEHENVFVDLTESLLSRHSQSYLFIYVAAESNDPNISLFSEVAAQQRSSNVKFTVCYPESQVIFRDKLFLEGRKALLIYKKGYPVFREPLPAVCQALVEARRKTYVEREAALPEEIFLSNGSLNLEKLQFLVASAHHQHLKFSYRRLLELYWLSYDRLDKSFQESEKDDYFKRAIACGFDTFKMVYSISRSVQGIFDVSRNAGFYVSQLEDIRTLHRIDPLRENIPVEADCNIKFSELNMQLYQDINNQLELRSPVMGFMVKSILSDLPPIVLP